MATTFIPEYGYYYFPELIVNDAQTWTAWTLNLVSSSLSAICGMIILFVIFRSAEGLSTTYHRIMAFFTFNLMMANIGCALGTIPMPKDNIYPFAGPSLGTDATCVAQAFLLSIFSTANLSCNVWLPWYYVSILVFKLKPRTIALFIEPTMLVGSLVGSLWGSIFFLLNDYFHVDPLNNYCTINPTYPFHCIWMPGQECDNYDEYYQPKDFLYSPEGYDALINGTLIMLYTIFGSIVVAMLTIIVHTYLFERSTSARAEITRDRQSELITGRNSSSNNNNTSDYMSTCSDPELGNEQTTNGLPKSSLKYTRIVSFQAMLYIFSFFICYIPSVISLSKDSPESGATVYYRVVIFQCQGIFNLFIFLYHKVHNIRRSSQNLTTKEALKQVFASRAQGSDFFLDNLTLVQLKIDESRARQAESAVEAERQQEETEEQEVSYQANTAEMEKFEGVSFNSPGHNSASANTDRDGMSFDPSSNLSSKRGNDNMASSQGKDGIAPKNNSLPSNPGQMKRRSSYYGQGKRTDIAEDDSIHPYSTQSYVSST